MIATEILIPEWLFRRIQAQLDEHPDLSFDGLLTEALKHYLIPLKSHS